MPNNTPTTIYAKKKRPDPGPDIITAMRVYLQVPPKLAPNFWEERLMKLVWDSLALVSPGQEIMACIEIEDGGVSGDPAMRHVSAHITVYEVVPVAKEPAKEVVA